MKKFTYGYIYGSIMGATLGVCLYSETISCGRPGVLSSIMALVLILFPKLLKYAEGGK
jgi:hypothetical protein